MLNELNGLWHAGLLDMMLDNPKDWDSLIIDRRKPTTYRLFTTFGKRRLCLHKFNPCDSSEAFPHPHPWPGAFRILSGSYNMKLGWSKDRFSEPDKWTNILLTKGSSYEIVDPLLWHSVIPTMVTHTIMLNDEPWPEDIAHSQVRRTAGKDLEKMTDQQKYETLQFFKTLIRLE